jgi:Uncharacterized protein, possibly involved in motility
VKPFAGSASERLHIEKTKKEDSMVKLTQINGQEIVVNADLIETLDRAHDTIITLTTGRKIRVNESVDEIIERVVEYRRKTGYIAVGSSRAEQKEIS